MKSNDHTMRHMTSQVQVPGATGKKPFKEDVTWTWKGTYLNYPLTAAGHTQLSESLLGSGLRLLGMTSHQNPSSWL
jgi:hypothetical protein